MSRRLQKKLEQAYARFRSHDWNGAERLCAEMLAEAPRNAAVLHLLGLLKLQDGKARDAITLLCQALDAGAQDAQVLDNLGVAYLAAREYEKAEASFRKLIGLGAGHATVYMRLGLALDGQGKGADAEAALRSAADRSPDDPDVHLNLGNIRAGRGRLDEALQCYHTVLTLSPGCVDAHYNRATVLERLGRLEESVSAYRDVLALAPQYVDAHNNLGIAYERLGRVEDAIESYSRALALEPDNVHALANLGKVLPEQGRLEEAMRHCARALELRPDFVDARVNLGYVALAQGRYADALGHYERALAIDAGSGDAHFNHGMLCLAMGDFARGWRGYQWRPARLRALSSESAFNDTLPEDLSGKTVLLPGEQGLGDEIFFLRFAPALKARGARLICGCDPKIANLLGRTGIFDAVVAHGEPMPPCDLKYLAGDLPLMLIDDARSARTPPALRLSVLDARRAAMRKRMAALGPPPYLGLTWRAGTPPAEQTGRVHRGLYKAVPLDVLAGALEGVAGTLLALQRNPRSEEISALRRALGRDVHDVSDANEDLEDMLALLALIDEYVGVSNTNMHLMAGIERAARVLVPHPPEWRWMLEGEGSPWFAGFTVYRQLPNRDWSVAQARLAEDLRRALSQTPRA